MTDGGDANESLDELAVAEAVPLFETALEAARWQRLGGPPGLYARWSNAENTASIVVPHDAARPDFQELLIEAAAQYGRNSDQSLSPAGFLRRLFMPATDQLLFRKATGKSAGRINWNAGMSLYAGAENSLLSAAKAALHRGRYFGRSGSAFASRFLDACYMGQTQIGSYVVTAEAPVTASFYESEARSAVPTRNRSLRGREITEVLITAMGSALDAAEHFERNKSVSGFEAAVSSGVSSDLIRAMQLLVSHGSEAEVIADWSKQETASLPSIATSLEVSRIDLSPAILPALKTAVAQLETEPAPVQITVRGWGSVIRRPSPSQSGSVKLTVFQGSEAGTLRIPLDQQYFEVAAEAIASGAGLEITGWQHRERSSYHMRNVSSVTTFVLGSDVAGE